MTLKVFLTPVLYSSSRRKLKHGSWFYFLKKINHFNCLENKVWEVAEGERVRNPGEVIGPGVFAIRLFWTLSQAQKENIEVARSLGFPSCFISLDLWDDLVILLLKNKS